MSDTESVLQNLLLDVSQKMKSEGKQEVSMNGIMAAALMEFLKFLDENQMKSKIKSI